MIELRVSAELEGKRTIERIGALAIANPGEHELTIVVVRGSGEIVRTLRFGPEWRYDGSAACLAALGEFGEATLRHD